MLQLMPLLFVKLEQEIFPDRRLETSDLPLVSFGFAPRQEHQLGYPTGTSYGFAQAERTNPKVSAVPTVVNDMERYDPDRPIDSEEWMALDEGEREYLVKQYHRKKRIKMPNLRMHAMFHVVVENQIALGDDIPAQKTLGRLMREGLSRHDAVHAIGSVVASHMFNLIKHGATSKDPNTDYYRQLEELTAEGWLNSSNDESQDD
jgi:hypothetical protein